MAMKKKSNALFFIAFLFLLLAAALFYWVSTGNFTAPPGSDVGEAERRMATITGGLGGIAIFIGIIGLVMRSRGN